MARNIKETIEKTEVVPHGRSLRSDATVGRLVGDHFLRVQLLYACGCLRFRRPRRALLSRNSGCSALVPPCALPVFGAGARSHTFVCIRLCRAQHDNAVTCCKNCHADAQRIQAAQPPFIPAANYLISLASHDTISTPTMTHTERTYSGSNGDPRCSNGAPSDRRRQRRAVHHASRSGHPREGEGPLGGVHE